MICLEIRQAWHSRGWGEPDTGEGARMNLNFWQWIGILVLIVGAIGYVFWKDESQRIDPDRLPPATTQPVEADIDPA